MPLENEHKDIFVKLLPRVFLSLTFQVWAKRTKGSCKVNPTKHHFNNEAHSTKNATIQFFSILKNWNVGVNFSKKHLMPCFIHWFLLGCLYLVLSLCLAHQDKVIKKYNKWNQYICILLHNRHTLVLYFFRKKKLWPPFLISLMITILHPDVETYN